RRLLQRGRLEPPHRGRACRRRAPGAVPRRLPHDLRRGHRGRALPRHRRRPDLQAGRLAGPAAPTHRRPLLAEGGKGQRLQGLVQRRQLVRDTQQMLARVELAVERVHFVAEAVEALEQRVELSVAEILSFHGAHVTASSSSRVLTTVAPSPSLSSTRARAPGPASSASIRRVAPRWDSATRASSGGASVKTTIRVPPACSRLSALLTSASRLK